jgi:hypothetical protein
MTEAELRKHTRAIMSQPATPANKAAFRDLVAEATPFFGGRREVLAITGNELDKLIVETCGTDALNLINVMVRGKAS